MPTAGIAAVLQEMLENYSQYADTDGTEIMMLPEYEALYEQNPDIIGWLRIEDTVIDYPVMQTMEDEDYYLAYDFNKEANNNGCLIKDTDSVVGVGTVGNQYEGGEKPNTNLIIHGHTMKSWMMFGGLKKYAEESYGREHAIISFDSLYEKREYELIAVFYLVGEDSHLYRWRVKMKFVSVGVQSPTEIKASGGLQGCADEICQQS